MLLDDLVSHLKFLDFSVALSDLPDVGFTQIEKDYIIQSGDVKCNWLLSDQDFSALGNAPRNFEDRMRQVTNKRGSVRVGQNEGISEKIMGFLRDTCRGTEIKIEESLNTICNEGNKAFILLPSETGGYKNKRDRKWNEVSKAFRHKLEESNHKIGIGAARRRTESRGNISLVEPRS
jgi:hypothetical protein